MQMASAQLEKPSRPETDYERWLRDHDENYRPGDRPLYGPGVKGTEDATENVKWKDRLSDGKKNYSAIYGIILSVVLAIMIIKSVKAYRKRYHRGRDIPLSGKDWDK
ncbi:hypothetical protein BDV23DRAFT_21498 [Aspergillus alliaceus]|uniref:Uncharacterized protein n=1 Tax=Petromyces alliaceus TaxID=209559 RepID=A0A5N7BTQ7_PETAA|nr:hypothetical protein BDV23DRAFT_21498 [Aspergillus alliaceus]